MPRQQYLLTMPKKRTTSVVFASPHSGRDYPWNFIRKSILDEHTIRSSEDAFVDRLYDQAPVLGAPLLCAVAPRAYVDLNRSAEELDPALITGVRQTEHNPRLSSGLGVIPRVVAGGREIRSAKISLWEANDRLDRYYFPYHKTLKDLLAVSKTEFGQAILFDCHSMPKDALLNSNFTFQERPDVVLGDRFGASCNPEIMSEVDRLFTEAGFKTSRNQPFAGAFVARQYGRPTRGYHALQIEIERCLYMNEETIQPNENFDAFKLVLTGIIEQLVILGRQEMPLAAE